MTSFTFPMNLNRYSQSHRILHLKPGAAGKAILLAHKCMEKGTRLNQFLVPLIIPLGISYQARIFVRSGVKSMISIPLFSACSLDQEHTPLQLEVIIADSTGRDLRTH
jgi:hypothetical protein